MKRVFEKINQYLWCGYLPPDEFPSWISGCILPENAGKKYTTHEASDRFDLLFNGLVNRSLSGRHIVPISGGFDSRAILCALIERESPNKIVAFTYGVPGQLDFELGKMVADSVGVEHHAIDLTSIELTWEKVRRSVIKSPWTYVPDGLFNSLCRNLVSDGSDTIWSGFLGDPLAGSHLSVYPINPNKQKIKFSLKQQRTKDQLCSPGFFYADHLPFPQAGMNMGYDDASDLGLRQACCIASIVLPIEKMEQWGAVIGPEENGAQVIAPFADKNWAGYWLSAPRELRKGQKLYHGMLKMKYPKLFSIPTKADLGIPKNQRLWYWTRKTNLIFRTIMQNKAPLLRSGSPLMRNYLDYDEMFRMREDYQTTLATAFNYLKENRITPWLNLDKLWIDHRKHRKNYGDAFCVLIGLAANILENPLEEEDEK